MTVYSKTFIVEATQTAREIGSGDLDVLATPALIAMIENTARDFLSNDLAEEETSVGIKLDIKHLRPSIVGAEILVNVNLEAKEGSKVAYSFEVYDSSKLIATGTHQRAVVVTEVFLSRL